MRIGFLDIWDQPYGVATPFERPLGGTQSAACYLAIALAAAGHQVSFLNKPPKPGPVHGVWNLPAQPAVLHGLNLDALIVLQRPAAPSALRKIIGNSCQLILLSMDVPELPMLEILRNPTEQSLFDAYVLVSDWQRQRFLEHFQLPPEKCRVLRNAMAPAFQNLFATGQSILAAKAAPPTIAYTSTPFRGLEILLEIFPRIRRRIPGIRLLVFSSMRVYLANRAADEQQYGKLYDACRDTADVQYVGSLPQPDLARTLRSVSLLAYPNTYEETSCIALIEALAAGCRVVTTDLAALPETAAGHARLIPPPAISPAYQQQFIDAVVESLETQAVNPAEEDARRQQQVAHFNEHYTWPRRAAEWIEFLRNLPPRP